jgi:glutamate formiminotransferase/formiminotetrahydrofolate cyclodeaminase
MKIGEQKISKFLKELGSSSPTPGGGATAALTGAIAASLVEMVASLTIGKKRYEEVNDEMQKIRNEVLKLKKELIELCDEDVRAFNAVIASYKVKDKEKIKKALQLATQVPSKVASLSGEVGRLAQVVAKKGNKNAYSDAKSALHLTHAAIEVAKENIRINKQSLASLK